MISFFIFATAVSAPFVVVGQIVDLHDEDPVPSAKCRSDDDTDSVAWLQMRERMVMSWCDNFSQLYSMKHCQEELVNTSADWGQRWVLAQFAPLNPRLTDEGPNERLGCVSTSLAEVMYYHRRCPTGKVGFTVPGYQTTAMDFDEEAAKRGLCDWSQFVDRPRNVTTDAGTSAVARYIYAMALTVKRKWGSYAVDMKHYLIDHDAQDAAVSAHYGMAVSRFHLTSTDESRREAEDLLVDEIKHRRPVIAYLARSGSQGTYGHMVVMDGFRGEGSAFEVRVKAGYDGYNSGWFRFDGPYCFHGYTNGTHPLVDTCARLYSNVGYLKFVRPETVA